MRIRRYYLFACSFVLILLGCEQNRKVESFESQSVFKKLSSGKSGVTFSNSIQADVATKENVFDFDYFYNGSGVGVVDINNDGLQDIIFLANQSNNELYLNKGDLEFENITKKSGINAAKGWATGVTFADVNNDGWEDIYISQGGPDEGARRTNLLFINQKDLTFKEAAKEYGLNDSSISSQSAFFDFDKDGDLDCLVMNENMLYGVEPGSFFNILKNDKKLLHHSSSHLYENADGKYIDVTEKAGILTPSFGLGLSISDINDDGWLDVYIANDYYIPDAIYINQGDGTFENQVKQLTNQVSFFGMGVDIADINNDGNQDIFVLDMASSDHYRAKTLMASMNVKAFDFLVNTLDLHHQYMFNSLQLNQGNGKFQNIAQLTGLSKTDWSWAGLIADFNNSGAKDIYVTNGYKKYALDNDIRTRVLQTKNEYRGNVPVHIKQEIYDDMPSEKLSNIMYENVGNLDFQDATNQWGLFEPSFSNGAAHADLDNDGDLDLVVSNIDDEAFIFQNLATDRKLGNYLRVKTIGLVNPSFAKVSIEYADKKQFAEVKRVRGYLSSMDGAAHFGLGEVERVDRVKVEWPSGKVEVKENVKANSSFVFEEEEANQNTESRTLDHVVFKEIQATTLGLDFYHKENDFDDFELESLLPYKQSTLGPNLAVGDVNGDGLQDIYIGGALGQSGALYIQDQQGTFKDNTPPSIQADAVHEDLESLFLDIDNDEDLDLFVVSGGYEFLDKADEYKDRLYINDGMGGFDKAVDPTLNNIKLSGRSVCTLDYNNDGLKDLVIGNRVIPGAYPKAPGSILLENTGSSLVDVTEKVIPGLKDFGMVNKVLSSDFNKDGQQDLIVVGEWTSIGLFENQGNSFKNVSASSDLADKFGWWYTVTETDVNNDGFADFIVGNVGLNSKYKATSGSPLKVYASDFDENGTWDIVLSNKYKGNYVPFRGRECSSNQMPFIKADFPTYDLFAKATIEDVYGDKLNNAFHKQVNEFRSVLLTNKGDGTFELKPLPIEAQVAPILSCISMDINHDGFEDIVSIGTIYNTEVETPRLDAGSGVVLIADGEGFYHTMSTVESGLFVEGNVKSSGVITIGGMEHLVFGRNNGELALFKLSRDYLDNLSP